MTPVLGLPFLFIGILSLTPGSLSERRVKRQPSAQPADPNQLYYPDIEKIGVHKCSYFGNAASNRADHVRQPIVFVNFASKLPAGYVKSIQIFSTISHYKFRFYLFEQTGVARNGDMQFKMKFELELQTTKDANERIEFFNIKDTSGADIQVRGDWYAGIGTSKDSVQFPDLPVSFDPTTDGQVHGYEKMTRGNLGATYNFTRSNKRFSFNVQVCPPTRPVIFNTDKCQYTGKDLVNNSQTILDTLREQYLNVVKDNDGLIPVEARYIHSFWAYVTKPSIPYRWYIYQKVSDPKRDVFIVKHYQDIPAGQMHEGINQIDIFRNVKDLADFNCDPVNETSFCSLRIGLYVNGDTSPIPYKADFSIYASEYPDDYNYEPDIGTAVAFGINSNKRFSIGVISCVGPSPRDPRFYTTTEAPVEEDYMLYYYIAAAVGGAIVLLVSLGLVCWCVKSRKSKAAHRKSKKEEAMYVNATMQDNNPIYSNMGTDTIDESLLDNPAYVKKTLPRFLSAKVSSALQVGGNSEDAAQPKKGREMSLQTPTSYLALESEMTDTQEVLQIPEQEITFVSELKGALGSFAEIWVANWNWRGVQQKVVVKRLNVEAPDSDMNLMDDKVNFLAKMKPHPFILGFIGTMTYEEATAMVLEHCAQGTMKSFLLRNRASRKLSERLKKTLPRFCYEIAEGMAFLHRQRIVHKRLWTRNVLLTSDLRCKIFGFGPKRDQDLKEEEASYERWMAVEVLGQPDPDYTKYTDVWAYGVTAWEVYSVGALPMANQRAAYQIRESIQGRFQLPRPKHCGINNYQEIMMPCWERDTDDRPTFENIASLLQIHSDRHNKSRSLKSSSHDYLSIKGSRGSYVRPIPSGWKKPKSDGPETPVFIEVNKPEPEQEEGEKTYLTSAHSTTSGSTHMYDQVADYSSEYPESNRHPYQNQSAAEIVTRPQMTNQSTGSDNGSSSHSDRGTSGNGPLMVQNAIYGAEEPSEQNVNSMRSGSPGRRVNFRSTTSSIDETPGAPTPTRNERVTVADVGQVNVAFSNDDDGKQRRYTKRQRVAPNTIDEVFTPPPPPPSTNQTPPGSFQTANHRASTLPHQSSGVQIRESYDNAFPDSGGFATQPRSNGYPPSSATTLSYAYVTPQENGGQTGPDDNYKSLEKGGYHPSASQTPSVFSYPTPEPSPAGSEANTSSGPERMSQELSEDRLKNLKEMKMPSLMERMAGLGGAQVTSVVANSRGKWN